MGIKTYLIKRVFIAMLTLWIVASLNFVIFQVMAPVDPATLVLNPRVPETHVDMLRQMYGLDEDLHIRYVKYLQNLLSFGLAPPYFGVSFQTQRFVTHDLGWRLSLTLLLLGSALIGGILVGVPVGVLAAAKRGTRTDVAAMGIGLFTWGVPLFFIQLLFLMFFYWILFTTGVKVFPLQGSISSPAPKDPLAYMLDLVWHVSLPVITLVVAGFAGWSLYTRNLLIDALTQDYVVTARAKGVGERAVLYKHAFRGILPPMATMITLSIPGIVTGAVITESIFGWKGIGTWYLRALTSGDYPVTQAVLWIYAVLMILFNFFADILYGILDPRIRVGMRR